MKSNRVYEFGADWEYRFDIGKRELKRNKEVLNIGRRREGFELLVFLVEQGVKRKSAIPAAEVIDAVWGKNPPADTKGSLTKLHGSLCTLLRDETLKAIIERQNHYFHWRVPVRRYRPPSNSPAQLLSGEKPEITGELPGTNSLPQSGHYYYILSRATNLALDVAGREMDDGQPVQMWNVPGWVTNQLWRFEPTTDGHFLLIAKHSDKCLDVRDEGRTNGTGLIQYSNHGGENQQWKLTLTEDGFYKLQARHSGLYLDRDDLGFGCGAKLQTWSGNTWPNQEWDLVREEHLLINEHFIVDCRIAGGLGKESVGLLLSLLSELATRRATFFCIVDTSFLKNPGAALLRRLCSRFPANFRILSEKTSVGEAMLVSAASNPQGTLLTGKEQTLRVGRVALTRQIQLERGKHSIEVPLINLLVGSEDRRANASKLVSQLSPLWRGAEIDFGNWKPVRSGDSLPTDAMVAGHEADGTPIFVGRAYYQQGIHPGKITREACHIAFGEAEIVLRDYEILLETPGQWREPEPGCARSLFGGSEHGNPLFVCRAEHEGGVHPGKVVHGECIFSFGGKSFRRGFPHFQVYGIPRT